MHDKHVHSIYRLMSPYPLHFIKRKTYGGWSVKDIYHECITPLITQNQRYQQHDLSPLPCACITGFS